MCIACEMAMFFAMDDIPPSTGTASHEPADAAARFSCEAPADDAPTAAPPNGDERQPVVKSRE